MDAFIWPSPEETECWKACPNVIEEEVCTVQSGALWEVIYVLFFSRTGLVLDHPVSIGRAVNDQYYWTVWQDKERRPVPRKQPPLLEHDFILLLDNATFHGHRLVQTPVRRCGWRVLAQRPYSTWLLFLGMSERTFSWWKVWIGRRYQHCSHGIVTSSEQGWTQPCSWSLTACRYVCIYVCVYIYLYLFIYISFIIQTNKCTTHTHTHTHIYIYIS